MKTTALKQAAQAARTRAEGLVRPTPEMVAEARRRAERAADEHGVPIDRICVIGTRWGRFHTVVLDDD